MNLRIFEGPVYNNLYDISKYDYRIDGYCSYKNLYVIASLEYYNKSGNKVNALMQKLAERARRDGREFPQNFEPDYKFFVCRWSGLPIDGGYNYDRCYFNNIKEVIDTMKGKLNESLREQIRTAIREDTKARKYIKWSSDSQPNLYQLDLFLRKSGYRLTDVVVQDNNPEVLIEPLNPSHLAPDIIHQPGEGKFFIDVKKYGELEYSDVEELIKGYTTAVEVVKHLEKLDLSKLEYEKEDQGDDQSESGSFSEEAPRK